MAKKEKIFNDRRRKVFRKHIPSSEVLSSMMVALVLVMGGVWFFAQQENYDPSERDISMELMEEGSVEDKLYRTPLQRWMDPAIAHAAVQDGGVHLGIFPDGLLSGGWQPATRLQEFDESTLYEKINGAAPQYFQFGFERLHYIGIEQPMLGLGVNIELYDMGEYQNALGLFNAQRAAERVVQQQENVQYYNTEIGALGVVGPYYFKITGDSDGELIEEKAAQLVQEMNALFTGSITPPYVTAFQEALDLPFDGLSYEKTDVFQFQFAEDFWFGTPTGAGSMRYFVHNAGDPAAAEELYTKMLENLLFDFAQVETTDHGAVLKHNFLNNYFVLERDAALVFGAENIPELEQVEQAATLLRTALANEAEENY